MAGRDLGQAPGLAAATGAYVCFEDEAGQALRPPKARTWARRGHTPVAVVPGKGSGRVSAAGLACFKPGARGRFFYRIRIHRGRKGERRSLSEAGYAELVTAAHCQLRAPVILVWDNLLHVPGALPDQRLMRAGQHLHPFRVRAVARYRALCRHRHKCRYRVSSHSSRTSCGAIHASGSRPIRSRSARSTASRSSFLTRR